MGSFKSRFSPSFTGLNIAQFCTTLNDNLFKLLLAFFLIKIKGPEHSYTILSLAGAIFVVPFIIFATPAGTLADRFSKRTVIFGSRFMEVVATALGVVAFILQSGLLGYLVLFLLSLESAIFSPCKYGIIPEIVPQERVSHYNGLMTASTYLAVIFGTFLASFLVQATQEDYILAAATTIIIALLGSAGTLLIKKTEAQAAKKKISFSLIGENFKVLKKAKQRRYLFEAILFAAYFLFMAAYTQLNMIPFAMQSLHLSELAGGYIFLMTAVGIGVGSYFAGQLSGYEAEIGFAPLAVLGSGLSFLSLYFVGTHLVSVVICLLFLGFFGGFYIVPLDIFIQMTSPDSDRGQNLAVSNLLSFTGVISASLLLAFLGNILEFSAAAGFAIMGILACFVSLCLSLLFADQMLRLLVAAAAFLFWKLQVVGKRRLAHCQPMIIVGQRRTWLDILIIMAVLPRRVRYIVPVTETTKRHKLYYKLLKVIPLDQSCYTSLSGKALKKIETELQLGHSVCIMHPPKDDTDLMRQWREIVESWLKDVQIPALPLYIAHDGDIYTHSRIRQFFSLFGKRVKVGFGLPIKVTTD